MMHDDDVYIYIYIYIYIYADSIEFVMSLGFFGEHTSVYPLRNMASTTKQTLLLLHQVIVTSDDGHVE